MQVLPLRTAIAVGLFFERESRARQTLALFGFMMFRHRHIRRDASIQALLDLFLIELAGIGHHFERVHFEYRPDFLRGRRQLLGIVAIGSHVTMHH